ncbi:ribonuclease HII [Guyparkeria hydrothermalis]|uniref:ribonuclease HII n=1 Tax=Guyparkeria hydrothermalis TaxID=923 RepID=UPI002020F63D|nr:ribonuclease HII [Guyparkeria hydrothermalis]MCL7744478.1 ribonuclease HII [Guyparkeria hydrothermalis]
MPQADLFDDLDAMGCYCGVDEAGRGPLAGPVVAAAVILDPARPIRLLDDSKKLTEARREALFEEIREHAAGWAIAEASVAEIDEINILHASMLAMRRAVLALLDDGHVLDRAHIDGNRCPELPVLGRAVVGGDASDPAIAAASILAKVSRDRQIVALDAAHPGYGLARHKGYPTPAHLAALAELGPSPIHRRSFAPVRRLLP